MDVIAARRRAGGPVDPHCAHALMRWSLAAGQQQQAVCSDGMECPSPVWGWGWGGGTAAAATCAPPVPASAAGTWPPCCATRRRSPTVHISSRNLKQQRSAGPSQARFPVAGRPSRSGTLILDPCLVPGTCWSRDGQRRGASTTCRRASDAGSRRLCAAAQEGGACKAEAGCIKLAGRSAARYQPLHGKTRCMRVHAAMRLRGCRSPGTSPPTCYWWRRPMAWSWC